VIKVEVGPSPDPYSPSKFHENCPPVKSPGTFAEGEAGSLAELPTVPAGLYWMSPSAWRKRRSKTTLRRRSFAHSGL